MSESTKLDSPAVHRVVELALEANQQPPIVQHLVVSERRSPRADCQKKCGAATRTIMLHAAW